LEEGKRIVSEKGTVQGGSISPLLANIYLHYVFDLWSQQWRKRQAHGEMILVRYADDFLVGFQSKAEAETFLTALQERFAPFGLELHTDKTRLIEFGPFAEKNRRERGQGKPETFNFLGFTHICGRKRSNGYFTVLRQTQRSRLQAKLAYVKTEWRRRFHDSIPTLGRWLGRVLRGHLQYYGVLMNGPALSVFRFQVGRLWHRALARRSQNGRIRWERMYRLIDRYLPKVRICHPYPLQRMGVTIQGRSRMR